MPRCWNYHDRAIAIQIVRLVETQVGGSIKAILLESVWIDTSSGCAGEAAIVDETMLRCGNEYRDARKVRYTTDVIPVCMCQENKT